MQLVICYILISSLCFIGTSFAPSRLLHRTCRVTRLFLSDSNNVDSIGHDQNSTSSSFVFELTSDKDLGVFKLGKKNNNPSPFSPEPRQPDLSRTGGDGDKVIVFTVFCLLILVQYFLFLNRDAPAFDDYIPLIR